MCPRPVRAAGPLDGMGQGLRDCTVPVAEALKEPPGTAPFKYVLSLTLADLESKLEAVKLSGLAAPLWSAIEKLRGQSAATGAALNAKFAAEGDACRLPPIG